MLLALRHIKNVERKSLITNISEFMTEDCYDVIVSFGKRDTKKRIANVINNLMNTALKNKGSINDTAHDVFLRSGNTNLYNLNWWQHSKNQLDLEREDSMDMYFIKAALAKYGVTYEEMENITKQNILPIPTAKDIKNNESLLHVYHILNDSLKKNRATKDNCILLDDPNFTQVYEYAVQYESEEVVYLRG